MKVEDRENALCCTEAANLGVWCSIPKLSKCRRKDGSQRWRRAEPCAHLFLLSYSPAADPLPLSPELTFLNTSNLYIEVTLLCWEA